MFKKLSALAIVLAVAVVSLSGTVSAAGQYNKLTPFVDCQRVYIDDMDGSVWHAFYFGYTNSSNKTIYVPYGENNDSIPFSIGNAGYPAKFDPGTHHSVVRLNTNDWVAWKLGDNIAKADVDTTPLCQ